MPGTLFDVLMIVLLIWLAAANVGDWLVAPVTPVCVGTHVNSFVPVVADALSGIVNRVPLQMGEAGAADVITGVGLTVTGIDEVLPMHPAADWGVMS